MRRSVLLALPACAALVALPALPAAAVVDTQTWTSASHQWWTSGTWSTGEAPENGDIVIFPSTAYPRSDVNYAVSLAGLQFTGDHLLGSASGGTITLTGSGGEALSVAGDPDPAEVTINVDLATTGTQSWHVAAGNTLTVPTWVTVATDGELVLDVDGTMNVSGNINGQVTGLVSKTGSGTVIRTGGSGGAIGGGGLDVREGEFLLDEVSLGTAFQTTGGTLSGDGVVDSITATSGVIAPSDAAADPIGILVGAHGVALNGGSYVASIDGDTLTSDYLTGGNGVLSGAGTTLELEVLSTPAIGDSFEIVGVQFGSIDAAFRLLAPAGDTLDEGDEFVSGGGLWSISYADVVTVTYLGLPPVTPEEDDELAETGVDDTLFAGLAAGAVLLTVGGLALALRRRHV